MASGYFQRLQSEGRAFYEKLGRTQKWILGGSAAAALVLIVGVSVWLQQPDWSTLYGALPDKDAGQIVAYLKENNVPYQIKNQGGGSVIQVPTSQVHELRMQMATQGMVLEGGVPGMELFDNEQIGMTNRVFDLNYQRALSGELSRTIMQIEGIDRARVHLVIPKKQIFSELQEPATASVNLKLKPMGQLEEAQIKGISRLVAGAVPGLAQKNVTITDGDGNLLFDAETASGKDNKNILNQEQLALQKQVETELRSNIEGMLARVVGREHVTVQVKALLDFDREESVSKSYKPNDNVQAEDNERVLRSEKTITEAGQGTDPVPGGVPGTDSNIPSYRNQTEDTKAQYNRSDTTRNYEVPETQTTKVKEVGQIKRLTLSVAIDSQAPAINSPEGLDSSDPLIVNLRNLAEQAAGFDSTRGDKIAISALPFDNSELERQQQQMNQADQLDFWTRALMIGLLGLVILVVFLGLVILWLRRRRAVEAEALDDAAAAFLGPENLLPALEPPSDPEMQEASMRRAQTVRSLSEMAKDDPARMARLLRVWMQEG